MFGSVALFILHTVIPTITPAAYIDLVTDQFIEAADPIRAEKQMAYMRNQFEYCGLGAIKWYPMAKEIFAQHGMYTGKDLKVFVMECYDQSFREVLYVGLEMMQRMLSSQNKKWISVLEHCITTHSWWDTVDWLSKLVGFHFRKYPELQQETAYRWIESDNMWLQRAAIIHQLFYKEQTDEDLLFDLIRIKADDKAFFIRKACGWALRQHTKTNPAAVIRFVENTKLSKLTAKEALRLL